MKERGPISRHRSNLGKRGTLLGLEGLILQPEPLKKGLLWVLVALNPKP